MIGLGFNGARFLEVAIRAIGAWATLIGALYATTVFLEFKDWAATWAYTAATFFSLLYLFMFICVTRQAVLETRINDMAKAKSDLEAFVLKNRQSSRKKGGKNG
ncbi:hypothetical protein ACW4YW_14940 [Methylobacillus pratensis]